VIRDARVADAPAIQSVAAAAWRDTYAGLLKPATIEAFIAAAYSIERLEQRIADDTVLVAEESGEVVAFADAAPNDERLNLFAIYVRPDRRRRGAGTLFLAELRSRFGGLPIAADVLDGNRKGEGFYERLGFVPREAIETDILGEPVLERRWWLDARLDG
jgi:GNAT superfamily N-acetyltransferase